MLSRIDFAVLLTVVHSANSVITLRHDAVELPVIVSAAAGCDGQGVYQAGVVLCGSTAIMDASFPVVVPKLIAVLGMN